MGLSRALIQVSDSFAVEYRTVTGPEATAKKLTLSLTPKDPLKTRLIFSNGSQQVYGLDYKVLGNELIWGGFSLETLIESGDSLVIEYFI